MVVTRPSHLRHNDFCSRVAEAGLDAANRQLGIYENNVSFKDADGTTRYMWGNSPVNVRLGGQVMYLYKYRMTWNSGQAIVHEAIHDLLNPRLRIPSRYTATDGVTTEIGLSIDESARYCMGLRGRR